MFKLAMLEVVSFYAKGEVMILLRKWQPVSLASQLNINKTLHFCR